MSGIDWSSELRKIEREFDGAPPEPKVKPAPKPRLKLEPTVRRLPGPARAAAEEKNDVLFVWARLALVAALAIALAFWPYARACGFGAYSFTGACAMTMVGGLWVSLHTWHNRMALAHALSLGLVLVGLMTTGAQIAPRVGYAKTDLMHPAHWRCAK